MTLAEALALADGAVDRYAPPCADPALSREDFLSVARLAAWIGLRSWREGAGQSPRTRVITYCRHAIQEECRALDPLDRPLRKKLGPDADAVLYDHPGSIEPWWEDNEGSSILARARNAFQGPEPVVRSLSLLERRTLMAWNQLKDRDEIAALALWWYDAEGRPGPEVAERIAVSKSAMRRARLRGLAWMRAELEASP